MKKLLSGTSLRYCRMSSFAIASAAVVFFGSFMMAQQPSPPLSPAMPHTIPTGTTILIRLDDRLDTGRVHSGQRFKGKLAEDLTGPDGTSIRRGARVKGHVSTAEHGLHPNMLLSFDEIDTGHGWIPFLATVTGVPSEHSVAPPDQEGTIAGREAAKRETDSSAGADPDAPGGIRAAGAKIGSRLGSIASLLANHDVTLPKGALLEVRLDRALRPTSE